MMAMQTVTKSPENTIGLDKLAQLAISDTGFVFDPASGQSFTLNSSGLFVIQQLRSKISLDTIAFNLTEEYAVSFEVALSSIEAFLLQLRRYL
jgi:hypothetical protein